jgi:hypothetical protein
VRRSPCLAALLLALTATLAGASALDPTFGVGGAVDGPFAGLSIAVGVACWEATYSQGGVRKNAAGTFSAKSD